MRSADSNLGVHQGARRILAIDGGDAGVNDQGIAAGAFVDTKLLYGPGFTHFMGQLSTTTPIATTLEVRVIPRINGTLSVFLPGFEVNEEFPVAVLTTAVGLNRYCFYWGESRGLVVGALGTGSTWCFSPVFKLRIRNVGAQPANLTSVEDIVCM